MELKDLRKMTSTKLREEALKYPEIEGVHGLNKEQLIAALAKVFGIQIETKTEKPSDVSTIKKEIRNLKQLRHEALENNKDNLSKIRKKIKKLKRLTRSLAK